MSAQALFVACVVAGGSLICASGQDRAAAGMNPGYENQWQWSMPSHAGVSYEHFRTIAGKTANHEAASRLHRRDRRRIESRIERVRERERLGTGGMSCHVNYGGSDEGYCYTYEPGFGTQHQPIPLLP